MKNFFSSKLLLNIYIILGAILLLGFILRVWHLWDSVIFAYDQARDASRIMGIIAFQHFKIVGPETDIPGVFNGVLFYYLLAPFYAIFQLNPNGVALSISIINIALALVVFYTARVLFKNNYIGLLAAFFWAISYEQIAYSHYISNASFMGIAALIFFLGCALHFLQNHKIGLPLSVIGFGMAIHFNFYLVYLGVFYVVFYFLFPQKLNKKQIFISLLILILFLAPFALAEVQFHFLITKSLFSYITHSGGSTFGLRSIIDDVGRYTERITDAVKFSYFSFNTYLAFFLFGFFVVFDFFKVKSRKSIIFLYMWLFSTLPLFAFHSGVLTVQVINSSLQGAFALLIAVGIWYLWTEKFTRFIGVVLFILIIVSNLSLLFQSNFSPNKFFVSEPMTIGFEKQVIDYTYKEAHGRQFSICAVTNPLLINTVWGYLYNWYGKGKYGYLPLWAGFPQTLQESFLAYDTSHIPLRFFIEEPLVGIPPEIAQAFIFMEDHTSILLDKKNFGGIIVEKRLLQSGQRRFIDTQELTQQQVGSLEQFTSASALYSCYNTY